MELDGVIHILVGSTFGLIVRMFIKYISGKDKTLYSSKEITLDSNLG